MPEFNLNDLFAPTQAIPSMSESGVSFMDQYYNPEEIPPAPEDLRDRSLWQEASQGASRGLHGLKSAGYGALGIGASVIGADEAKQGYFQQAQEQEALAQEHAAAIPGYEDINSIGDIPRWFLGLIGEQVPNIAMTAATTLATGGIGSLVSGGARASAALAGSAAVKKTIAEQGAKLAAKSLLEAEAKGYGAEAASISAEMVKTFLTDPKTLSHAVRARGAELGAKAGMVLGTAPVEAGGSWVENMQAGFDTPWSSITSGTLNGFIELMGGASKFTNLIFNPKTMPIGTKALGHFLKGAWEMSGMEAVQEGLQEVSTIISHAANDPNFEPIAKEQISRVINSALAGAVVGLGYGIPGTMMERGVGKRQKAQGEQELGIPQYIDPTQPFANQPPAKLSEMRDKYGTEAQGELPENLMNRRRVEDIIYLNQLHDSILTRGGLQGFTPEELKLNVDEVKKDLKEIAQNPIISTKDLSEIYNDPENPDLNAMMIEQGKEYQQKFKDLNAWVKNKGKVKKGGVVGTIPVTGAAVTSNQPGVKSTTTPPLSEVEAKLSKDNKIKSDLPPVKTYPVPKELTPGAVTVTSAPDGFAWRKTSGNWLHQTAHKAFERVKELNSKAREKVFGAEDTGAGWAIYKLVPSFNTQDTLDRKPNEGPGDTTRREDLAVTMFDTLADQSDSRRTQFLREVLIPYSEANKGKVPAASERLRVATAGAELKGKYLDRETGDKADYTQRLEDYTNRLYDNPNDPEDKPTPIYPDDIRDRVLPDMVRDEYGSSLLKAFYDQHTGIFKLTSGEGGRTRNVNVKVPNATLRESEVYNEGMLRDKTEQIDKDVKKKLAKDKELFMLSSKAGNITKKINRLQTPAVQKITMAKLKKGDKVLSDKINKSITPEDRILERYSAKEILDIIYRMYTTGVMRDIDPEMHERMQENVGGITPKDIMSIVVEWTQLKDRYESSGVDPEILTLRKENESTHKYSFYDVFKDEGTNLTNTGKSFNDAMSDLEYAERMDSLGWAEEGKTITEKAEAIAKHRSTPEFIAGREERIRKAFTRRAEEASKKDVKIPIEVLKQASDRIDAEKKAKSEKALTKEKQLLNVKQEKESKIDDLFNSLTLSMTVPRETFEYVMDYIERGYRHVRLPDGMSRENFAKQFDSRYEVRDLQKQNPDASTFLVGKKEYIFKIGREEGKRLTEAKGNRRSKLPRVNVKSILEGKEKLKSIVKVDKNILSDSELERRADALERREAIQNAKKGDIQEIKTSLVAKTPLTPALGRNTGEITLTKLTDKERAAINAARTGRMSTKKVTDTSHALERELDGILHADESTSYREDVNSYLSRLNQLAHDKNITISDTRNIREVINEFKDVEKSKLTKPEKVLREKALFDEIQELANDITIDGTETKPGKTSGKKTSAKAKTEAKPPIEETKPPEKPVAPIVREMAKAKAAGKKPPTKPIPVKPPAKKKPVKKPPTSTAKTQGEASKELLTATQIASGWKILNPKVAQKVASNWNKILQGEKWIKYTDKLVYETKIIQDKDTKLFHLIARKITPTVPKERGWKVIQLSRAVRLQTILDQFPAVTWERDESGVIHHDDETVSGELKVKLIPNLFGRKVTTPTEEFARDMNKALSEAQRVADLRKPKTFSEFVLHMKQELGGFWDKVKQYAQDLWNYVRYGREIKGARITTTPEFMVSTKPEREFIKPAIQRDPKRLDEYLKVKTESLAKAERELAKQTHDYKLTNLWAHYKKIKFFAPAENTDYYAGVFDMVLKRFDIDQSNAIKLLEYLGNKELLYSQKIQQSIGLIREEDQSVKEYKEVLKKNISPMHIKMAQVRQIFKQLSLKSKDIQKISPYWSAIITKMPTHDGNFFIREVTPGLDNFLSKPEHFGDTFANIIKNAHNTIYAKNKNLSILLTKLRNNNYYQLSITNKNTGLKLHFIKTKDTWNMLWVPQDSWDNVSFDKVEAMRKFKATDEAIYKQTGWRQSNSGEWINDGVPSANNIELRKIDMAESKGITTPEAMRANRDIPLNPISTKEIMARFPKAKFEKISNNVYNVTLPNGFAFRLNNKTIEIPEHGDFQRGTFGIDDGSAILDIVNSDSLAIDHETFHMVSNIFLTRGEQRMMMEASRRKSSETDQDIRENASDDFMLWRSKQKDFTSSQTGFFQRIIQGAKDLVYNLRSFFFNNSESIAEHKNPEELFNAIRSGEIYNRAPQLNLTKFPHKQFIMEQRANGLPVIRMRNGISETLDPRRAAKIKLANVTTDPEFMFSTINANNTYQFNPAFVATADKFVNGVLDKVVRNNREELGKDLHHQMGSVARQFSNLFWKATRKTWNEAKQSWDLINPFHNDYYMATILRHQEREKKNYGYYQETPTLQALKPEGVKHIDPLYFWGNSYGERYFTRAELDSPGVSFTPKQSQFSKHAFTMPNLTEEEKVAYLEGVKYIKDVMRDEIMDHIEKAQLRAYVGALDPSEFTVLSEQYKLLMENKRVNIDSVVAKLKDKESVKRIKRAFNNLDKKLQDIRKERASVNFLDGYFPQTRPPSSHYLNIFIKDKEDASGKSDEMIWNIPVNGAAEGQRELDKLATHEDGIPDLYINGKFNDTKYRRVFGRSTKPADSTFFMIGDINMTRIISLALGKAQGEGKISMKDADTIADNLYHSVADIIKARGASVRSIHRQLVKYERARVIEGYTKEDSRKILNTYVTGYFGMQSKFNAAMEFMKIAKSIPEDMADTYTELSTQMKDNLRNMDKWDMAIAKAKGFMFYYYLAGKMTMAYMQITQNFITAIPRLAAELHAMGKKDGWFQAEKYVLQAMRDMVMYQSRKSLLDPELVEIMDELARRGDTYSTFTRSMKIEAMATESRAVNKTLEYLSIPMKTFEEYNRRVAAATMYHVIKDKKLYDTTTEAGKTRMIKEMEEFMLGSHFWYARENQPILFQGAGLGRAGSLLYTFTSFPHNFTLGMIHSFLNYGGYGGLIFTARTFAYLTLFGGMMALPWLDDFIDMVEKLTDQPIRIQTRRIMQKHLGAKTHEIIAGGLPAVFGWDMAASIRPAKIPFYGDPMQTVFGVYGGMGQKLANFWDHFTTDQYLRATEDLSPVALENIIKAYRLYQYGPTTPSGKPVFGPNDEKFKLDMLEGMGQAIGLRPYDLSLLQQDRHEQNIIKQEWDKKYEKLNKRYLNPSNTDYERDLIANQYEKLNDSIPEYIKGFIKPKRPPRESKPDKDLKSYWGSGQL